LRLFEPGDRARAFKLGRVAVGLAVVCWALTWVRTLGHPMMLPFWPDVLDKAEAEISGVF
jgi:hypothetical protein